MKCDQCEMANDDSAKICTNCGNPFSEKETELENSGNNLNSDVNNDNHSKDQQRKSRKKGWKKGLKISLYVIIAIAVCYAIYWISLPNYTISPETTEVRFERNGGEIKIGIKTDADFTNWYAEKSSIHEFWFDVIKNRSSITIKCEQNDMKIEGERRGVIKLYCDGKNKSKVVCIKVFQDESTIGEIEDLTIKELIVGKGMAASFLGVKNNTDSVRLIVKYQIRHYDSSKIYKCRIEFFDISGCNIYYHGEREEYLGENGHLIVQKKICGGNSEVELFLPYSCFSRSEMGERIHCSVTLLEIDGDYSKELDKEIYEYEKFTVE